MSGVLFGATFLAASTSIPEVSTGITAIRIGDYDMALSDIFGGNAFLPVYLASLGILLTSICIFGLVTRPKQRHARLGLDSWLVLIVYIVGISGLFFVHNQSH